MLNPIEEIEIKEDLDHDYETPIKEAAKVKAILWQRFMNALPFAAFDILAILYLIKR